MPSEGRKKQGPPPWETKREGMAVLMTDRMAVLLISGPQVSDDDVKEQRRLKMTKRV